MLNGSQTLNVEKFTLTVRVERATLRIVNGDAGAPYVRRRANRGERDDDRHIERTRSGRKPSPRK
jgi:hypothetical protein